jgi:Subtilase family
VKRGALGRALTTALCACACAGVGVVTSTAFGQAIPGQPPQQPGRPDQPPGQPPSQPRGNGIGGIGLSIKLGGKKKPPPLPPGPPLEMRDADVADHLPDQVIFVISGQATNAARIAKTAKVTIIEVVYLDESDLTMVVAQLGAGDTPALAEARLEKISGVSWAQPNYQFQLLGSSLPKRFALHAIPEKQPSVSGRIVMIDAPVDMGHDNLKGAALTQSYFGVSQAPAVHGTVVAALLAGTGAFPGTAKGAKVTSLAAFGPSAAGASLSRTSYLARAMNEASRLRPDVLNLSFGGPFDRLLGVMLDTVHKNGVCVSAAAGNGGPTGKILFPATHPASLAVTAVDEKLRGYAYASQGARVDVAGVGVSLNAAVPGGRRAVSGTSFATAVVSGALLRMPACNGARSPASMKAQVAAYALDLGAKGRDPVFGAGLFRLSAGKAKK